MKVVQVADRKSDTGLKIVEMPVPQVTDGMLLVKVKAAGVNFADLMQRHGDYPRVLPTPYVPGYEVAGEVIAVGAQVEGFAVGDRVAAMMPLGGGFAEYALVHQRLAVALPAALGFAESTALLTQGLTAYIMVEKFVRPGQSVLITAAAGGVGNMALQLAIAKGARPVTGAVSNAEKAQLVEQLGATGIIYNENDWAKKAKIADMRFDVILDAVGGETLQRAWTLLNDFGSLVIYGNASASDLRLSQETIGALPFNNHSLHFYGFSRCLEADPQLYRTGLSSLIQLALLKKLRVPLHPAYSLVDVEQAFSDVAMRRTLGKVVLAQ